MENLFNTYVIGDVHGHYDTLKVLIDKLPKNSKLIFVGDLVDRGLKSRELIEFIRTNDHLCVLGNHEEMMIRYGEDFISNYPKSINTATMSMWLGNGGKNTLLSYGLIKPDHDLGKIDIVEDKQRLEIFKKDIEWLKTLPLYIETPFKKDLKPVVISHSGCANVWHYRNDSENKELFKEYCLWKRDIPKVDSPIFNIFGHTPVDSVDTTKHYINVDTGCYLNEVAYSRLSGYCIETGEVVSARKVPNT